MSPRDRLGNRYLVNFIDHRSNNCRVFLANSKDFAFLKFKHFLVSFEREIDSCARTGWRIQNTGRVLQNERGPTSSKQTINQGSNGKSERMHRTFMNMARSMVIASNLPLYFWGNAAEYATYILNRSRIKSNPNGVSQWNV